MSPAAIFTLVITGLLVAALAFYLIWVVMILSRIVGTLGKVSTAVRTIADRTAPIGDALDAISTDLGSVAEAAEGLTESDERSPRMVVRTR